jgi:hypothetical protein
MDWMKNANSQTKHRFLLLRKLEISTGLCRNGTASRAGAKMASDLPSKPRVSSDFRFRKDGGWPAL